MNEAESAWEDVMFYERAEMAWDMATLMQGAASQKHPQFVRDAMTQACDALTVIYEYADLVTQAARQSHEQNGPYRRERVIRRHKSLCPASVLLFLLSALALLR